MLSYDNLTKALQRAGVNTECKECGHNDAFIPVAQMDLINNAPQFNILYTETDEEPHGQPIPAQYFAVMLICNHCGHVRQFSVDQLAKHLRASPGGATNE